MAFDITGQLNLRLASGAIRNIASEINSGLRSSGVGAVNIPVKADTASIKSLSSQLDNANSAVLKFAQQSGLAFKRFAAFSLAAGPVLALGSAFRNAASEAMSFDKEMLRLRQVSMDVGGEVKSIAAEVTRLSVGFGVSSQELIKTAVVLKQANLSIDETRIALEALAKSALAPNFDSMAQTTEGAIAVMNQFKIESKDLEQALGSMNAVAGEFAVEAGDLIEVVRRTGGAFKASGGDLNELMAIFTSVRQTTRESAESISTGLRTIFTRLQRNETVSQLKSIGVELRYTRAEAEQMGNIKLTDQFVGAYEAVHRLSQALAQIPESDSRFASISEELGGYRQIGKVIPMLKEFAVSERALMVAEAGRISLQVNAAQAADSYGNRLTKLSESYAAFGRTLMDTGTFKGAFSSFESLAKSILSVLDAARPLLPLLTAIAGVKLGLTITPFLREAASGVTQVSGKKKFAAGGLVPGSGNTDSVPVDLQPGSFVVRKSSVAKYGREAMSTLANGYAKGGKVSAMVMPGEFIFTPAQVSSIGSSTLNAVNSGSLEKFADGTQPKFGSSIGDFFKKMIGMDDDSKARRKLSSMSMSDDKGANLRFAADINKDPKVRNLLNKMEKEAIQKHGLQDMMAILPDIKGSRTIAVPSEDNYGYIHERSRGNRVALTDESFAKQSKTGQINTLGHEIIHLLDRQAGLRFPGAGKGDIGSKLLSENENSQTNKVAKLLQSYVERAVKKGYLGHSGGQEEALKYYTEPGEILARVMEGGVSGHSQFTKTVGRSLPGKQRAEFYKQTQELEATFRKEVEGLIELSDFDDDSQQFKIGPSVSPRKPGKSGAKPGRPQLPRPTPGRPKPPQLIDPSEIFDYEEGSDIKSPPQNLPAQKPPISSGSGSPQLDLSPGKTDKDLEEYYELRVQDSIGYLDDHSSPIVSPQHLPAQKPPISSGSGRPFGDLHPDKSLEDLEREIQKINEAYLRNQEFTLDDDALAFSLGDDLNLRDDDLPPVPKPARMPLQMAPLPAQKPPVPQSTKPTLKTALPMVTPQPLPTTIPPPPQPTTPSVSSPTAPQKKRLVNKTIQNLANSLGVDINAITGSGKGGALLKADIYAAAGVTPPPSGSRNPAPTPAPTPIPALDRSTALGIDNTGPDQRKQWHHDLGVNDPSTAMNREKLNSQDTINLLSDMSSSKSLGGAEALEKSIFRKISANKPDISPNDARIESAKRASDILYSAESMRKAQDTVETESGIKNQASSRISDIKRLNVYAKRANSLKERADHDPIVKNQRDEILEKMDAAKQRVAQNEGIDSNAIYEIKNDKYKISDVVGPLLKKLNRELVDVGRAAAENISEANKVIDEEKKKLSGIRATTTKDASGRYGVNFSGIDVGMNPVAPNKQITSPNGVVLNNTRDYGVELNDIAKNKNKVGFGASVTEEFKQEDFANLLSDMSKNKGRRKLLQKSIYESLQSTQPDLVVGDQIKLAKEQSKNIFDKANNFKNTKNEQFKFQALESEYSLRSDSIKNLPAIVDKVNSLKELSRLDPSVGPELKKAMDQLKETAKIIDSATGLQEEQYLSNENGKFSVRDAAKESLSRGMTQNQLMAETYGKQAKEAGKNAEVQLKDFDGMNASFIKDDVGRKGIRFGGDAGRYGAGPPEAPPRLPPDGGLTLAQLRQNRISDSMTKIDPIGGGKGLSEITKAAVIEEETNKLRREYADGMAQIIMTERKINSLEAARAIAIEEFNKNLHNHTLVTAKTDPLGSTVVNRNVDHRSSRPPSGSYGDLVAREYEDIVKKKDPKGKGLSDVSKQRTMQEAEANIKSQYLQTISTQVQKARQLTSIDDALIIAEEMRIKAIDENTAVVRKGNKIYDQGLLDSGVTGKNSIRDLVKSTYESLKKTFLNLDMAIAGISVGAAYIGDAISRSAGNAEDAVRGNEDGSFSRKKALGGAISGAGAGIGSGAFTGYTIGGPDSKAPLIMGVLGGVAGGLAGFVTALKEAEIEVSNVKIGESIKKIDEYLMNFAKGTVNFNAGYLRDQESILDKEQPSKVANQLSTLGMPFYTNDNFKAGVFGARKETMAQQVPARMDALSKIIEDRAKKEIGNDANMNEESRKKAFDDVLMENGGFGRAQLGQVASATGQDINLLRGKMLDMFKRIADNEAIRNKQEQSSSKINQSAVLFGNLSTALEISTQKLMEMSAASKNVTDVMDSNIGPFMGSGLASSLRQPFGAGREDFVNAIKTITDITGNNDDVVKQAETATMAGTLLPGIIAVIRSQPVANLARGENFGIQVGDTLQKALAAKGMDAGVSSSVVGMIQSQLGEEDFGKMLRESGQDMTKMVDSLLKPIVEPLTRNSEKMSKLMDDRAKDFADQIADMARRTRQKGEMMDAANDAEIAAVRNKVQISAKRGQIPEFAAETDVFNLALRQQQLRQNRLTNFGNGNAFPNQQAVADAQNPDMIFDALQGVVAKIKKAERNVDELSKGKNINASNQAITELANLKGRAADLNQALKNLTDTSERNAAAQEKLGKIQNEREGRQSLGMRYATSNIEGRAEIAKAFSLLNSAAKMGTAAPFTARDQNQIFSLLSSLSPQMRLQGLGGATVKDITSQLLDTTFGGAFSLDPQTAAMERALENFVQQNYEVASRAAQLQVDNQTNLMSELFGRLENSQTKFLSELAKINKETADLMKQTLILRASEEVSKLEKGGGELSMLGNIGIKDNEQFEVLKALVKNPKINADLKQVVAKRNEAAGLDATLKDVSRPEMLDLFSQRINSDIGKENLGTVGGTSMGVVLRRLEEIGLSENLRSEVFEKFKKNLDQIGGGTFEGRTNAVQEALSKSLKDVIGGRAGGARISADIAEKDVLKNDAKIDPKIVRNIALESEKAFGKSNFSDLETAIKAVENFGGKFEDFGKQLEAAKERLKTLAEPDKKANGGLIRFFNKGGWGSGGSTTPHGADTVNARINPNEFVVAAGPAQRNKELLEKINAGGLVGMADGGIVDEIYGNLNNAKSILSRQGKMIGGENEINEAKRLARINSAAMFLVQLKDIPKDQREKLIDEQIKILKDGPQNPFQEGIVDALNKIKDKRELQKGYEKEIKEFQEKKNTPAYQNLLPEAEKIHDAVKAKNVALSLVGAERIGNEEKIIQEIPDIRQKFAGRFDPNHAAYNASDAFIKNIIGKSLSSELEKNNKDRYDHFFSDDLAKDIPDSLFAQFRSVDGVTHAPNEIEKFRSDPWKKRNVKGAKRNKAEIIKEIYGGDINKYFEENVWQSGINSLSPSKQQFMADANEAFKIIRNKTLVPPIAFDYEESIKSVINAQLEEVKKEKEKNFGMIKAKEGMEKDVDDRRTKVFSTPQDQLSKAVGAINPMELGRDDMLGVIKAQNLAREAELFNQLNPALQAKYLEPLKASIRKNGFDNNFARLAGDKNLTSEEIAIYARDKNKFSLLQRANLEVMMEKVSADKKPDNLNEAEKYAYLISLESQAKTKAYDQVQDKKNRAGLNRMGQFLSANPGLINARMSAAEEKGAEAYANEAALIEMVMSYFGTPTKIPGVFAVFKDKNLIGGKPADAGVQPKKPEIFGANEAGEMGGGKPMGVPLQPAAPPVAAPADPGVKPAEAAAPAPVADAKLTYPWLPGYFGKKIIDEEIKNYFFGKNFDESKHVTKEIYDKNVKLKLLNDEKGISTAEKNKRNLTRSFIEDREKNARFFENNDIAVADKNPKLTYSWIPNYFGPKVNLEKIESLLGKDNEDIEASYNELVSFKKIEDEKGLNLKNKEIRYNMIKLIKEKKKLDGLFEKADGGLIKFASGGLVPGVGNTDSVRANLPVGSYVIRKSSVNKLGADTLASLPHMATGGVVPAMVMPGEHIFTPDESSKIGKGKLDYINQNGKLPGYFYGGDVPGGQPGGKKVNAQGAAVFGGGVPNQNGQWVFMPNGANPWAAGMPMNQGVMQNKAMPFGANANAGAIPLHAGPQNQMGVEKEFQQALAANEINLDRFQLADKKTEYYQLRNKLTKSRVRSKEDVAKFRKLHAELTNPFVVQADAAQRMLSAQEALAKFQESPKDFLEAAKSHRQVMTNPKANYKDRLLAKEMYEEYVLAARSIPPQALRAAMAGDKQPKAVVGEQQPKAQANNNLLEKEWAQRREGVAAHNAKMREKYGEKPTGPESVAAHNEAMEKKYGKKLSGPEAVKEHNEKIRAAEQNRPAPNPEAARANHLKKMLDTAQENYFKTGDPKFLEEIKKLKNPGQVASEEKADAQRKMDDYRAQKKKEEAENEIGRWHVQQGIEEIRDPGGVKRKAERERVEREAQEKKMALFYQNKEEKRREFEAKLESNYAGYEESRKKMMGGDEEATVRRASGGIVPGYGSGDHVPALLEPGEAVIPRKAVQKFANGGIVGGIQGFANGGMAQGGGPELLDVAAKFNQAATQISQGLSGFSTSVSTFNGAVASFGTFVDKFDEAVGKIPGQIELSGANEISVNLMGQDSIVKAVTEAIGPMIAEAIRANQPVEQRSQ